MHLENGRALLQGMMVLVFAAIAYWVSPIGLLLIALMGAMILQSAFSDWCLSDFFLRPMGLRKKLENRK